MSQLILNDYLTIALPFAKSNIHPVTVVEAYSGKSVAISHSDNDRKSYDVISTVNSRAEAKTFMDFYDSLKGSYDTFLFKDIANNTVTLENIGTGTGAEDEFQITENGFDRYNIEESPTDALVYDDGSLKTKTTDYSIAYTDSGLLTFTYYPGSSNPITITYVYSRRMRFQNEPVVTMENRYTDIDISFTMTEDIV